MPIEEIQARLDGHEQRLKLLETQRETDKAAVDEIKRDTGEIVDLLRDAQGAWRVFEMIGKAAKPLMWIAGVVAAISVFWANMTGKRS